MRAQFSTAAFEPANSFPHPFTVPRAPGQGQRARRWISRGQFFAASAANDGRAPSAGAVSGRRQRAPSVGEAVDLEGPVLDGDVARLELHLQVELRAGGRPPRCES